jgi:hypothetical protein
MELKLPPEIQRFMLEMQVTAMESRRKAVLADPVKHKLTLEFPEGARMNWRYWGTLRPSKNVTVRYCYATERNLAGYFLGWRETFNEKTGRGKRDQWQASKRRTTVRDKALARKKAHEKRLGRKKGD